MYRLISFTREDLFQKVWTTPVLRVAQEIGISDVALAKACRRAAIPLPTRGHWAIPADRRPAIPSLPTQPEGRSGTVQFSVLEEGHKRTRAPRPAVDFPRIAVPDALIDPHPLVVSALKAAKRVKPQDGRLNLSGEAVDVGVSPDKMDLVLRILDALIKACEQRGWRWEVGKEGTRVVCDGEKIRVRVWEVLNKRTLPPPAEKSGRGGRDAERSPNWWVSPIYEWTSTGRISVLVEDDVANRARRKWTSTPHGPLESKLHEVVSGLPLVAEGIRLRREEREAWKRQWEEDEARRKEIARQAEIERRLRSQLVSSLEQWERANRLRAFCEAAQSSISMLEGEERSRAEDWFAWVAAQVHALDPLSEPASATFSMEVAMENWYQSSFQRPPVDWWSKQEK